MGKGRDIAAVHVPPAIEPLNKIGRSCPSRPDKENRPSSRHQTIDFAGHDRPATDIALRYQADVARGQAFAETSPVHIRTNVDKAKVVGRYKRHQFLLATAASHENKTEAFVILKLENGAREGIEVVCEAKIAGIEKNQLCASARRGIG